MSFFKVLILSSEFVVRMLKLCDDVSVLLYIEPAGSLTPKGDKRLITKPRAHTIKSPSVPWAAELRTKNSCGKESIYVGKPDGECSSTHTLRYILYKLTYINKNN